MESLGICIGASTLSAAMVLKDRSGKIEITNVLVRPHNGNPRQTLIETLRHFSVDRNTPIVVTGRKFRHFVNLSTISEPEAVETALFGLNGGKPAVNAVISAGGETFLIYLIGKNGKISAIQTGNKCASGTGDFYIQQLKRMKMSLEDVSNFSRDPQPYRVSGRCSVFCKSDCTHATNKGVPREKVVSGLCRMMAGKILEIMKRIPKKDIMIIGGTSQNQVMMEYLRDEIENLIVPDEAPYFEAVGAGIWAADHKTIPFDQEEKLFRDESRSFARLPPIAGSSALVDFRDARMSAPQDGDMCILGLDVGSTTTKAVLVRASDSCILASVYLRTNGDPVGASRACYADLHRQLQEKKCNILITGMGVTGSGRQIAGLHAMADGIINEIIAHAAGALHYNENVDTILEIGGQDAKYTYIVNGVPSDYAMNDACSAGTGSFLEESAKETLGIEMEKIADIALGGENPPNFNDQCAAFISSDIKNAFHEGIGTEDIVSGLVYSIAMNYNSRVRGNRPIGDTVFMQGGVCYNKAVPMAMASLTGKKIIVPPEPGLMGAFGVALEVRRRMELGIMQKKSFSLEKLRDRTIEYDEPFICRGGREGCDRKCEISRIRIEGEVYPFGGACNRWYNLRSKIRVDTQKLNLALLYERLVFEEFVGAELAGAKKEARTVGINKSFLVNQLYPLLHCFFSRLGFRVRLPEKPEQEGMEYKGAAFCYPAEISHGYMLNLLRLKTDFLFLPQIKGGYVENGGRRSATCPISQAEPFYLRSAFKGHEELKQIAARKRLLTPVIDFSKGYEEAEDAFVSMSEALEVSQREARMAYREAVAVQKRMIRRMKEAGGDALKRLEEDPDRFAVVLFGRAYNANVSEANMGIPHKFASRGVQVIPCDFLPLEKECLDREMYWFSGQTILKGAGLVSRHPQLFGCFITNFSCGPDSFLVGYVRNIMERKPLLVLELDSHVADAGLETRIEAFIDIVRNYRELVKRNVISKQSPAGKATCRFDREKQKFIDSAGKEYAITDPHVHVVIPSMGRFSNKAAAAVFRGMGVRMTALEPADPEILKIGRGNTSCKECLPLLLTTGSLLKYLEERKDEDELLVYFMPTASGPCRFGQYSIFMKDLVSRRGLENVALFSLSSENSYIDLGLKNLTSRLWACIVISDILEDIYSVLLVNAEDTKHAMDIYRRECERILEGLEKYADLKSLRGVLETAAVNLRGIPVRRTVEDTPFILLTGEIFVRYDDLSRQFLVEKLAEHGFATKVSSMIEWIYYTDWCVQKGFSGKDEFNFKKKLSMYLRSKIIWRHERTIKQAMRTCGLFPCRLEDVRPLIEGVRHLIHPDLLGEAILTVGASMSEILEHYCGVIAIGPFGCMPNRIAESILSREMNREGKKAIGPRGAELVERFPDIQELPFLAIESDGNTFPQIITAKLETFLLQARRVYSQMVKNRQDGRFG